MVAKEERGRRPSIHLHWTSRAVQGATKLRSEILPREKEEALTPLPLEIEDEPATAISHTAFGWRHPSEAGGGGGGAGWGGWGGGGKKKGKQTR